MRMRVSIQTDKWTFVSVIFHLMGGQRGRKYFSNKKIQKCKCISSSGVSRKRKTYRHYRRITKPIGWTAPAIMTDTTDTSKDEVWREGKSDMVNGSLLVKKKKWTLTTWISCRGEWEYATFLCQSQLTSFIVRRCCVVVLQRMLHYCKTVIDKILLASSLRKGKEACHLSGVCHRLWRIKSSLSLTGVCKHSFYLLEKMIR